MHLTQQPQVCFPAFSKNFRGKIIDVAEANQQRWLEESGQWLKNVDLVLASGQFYKKIRISYSSMLVYAAKQIQRNFNQ